MIDIGTYFLTLAALAGLNTLFAGWLNTQLLTLASHTVKQVASWVTAMVIAFVGYFFHAGLFETLSIGWTIVYGGAIGLVSNGIFDIAIVQAILAFIGAAKKPKTA